MFANQPRCQIKNPQVVLRGVCVPQNTKRMCNSLGWLYTYRKICENGCEMRKTKSVQRGISHHFFHVSHPFCHFSHFTPRLAFARKLKGFRGLLFRSINKTRNSPEMRKVYSECFAFRGVFRKNIREILAKCKIQKVYSRLYGSVQDIHQRNVQNLQDLTISLPIEYCVSQLPIFACNMI